MFPGSINLWLPILTGLGGGLVSGGGVLILWLLNQRKFNAEIHKLDAEASKLDAEADDLTSARLIRELDRLSSDNILLGEQIQRLRLEVIEYAKREHRHVIEIDSLRLEVEELKRANAPTVAGVDLTTIFPVDIPHVPGEFDAGKTPGQPD